MAAGDDAPPPPPALVFLPLPLVGHLVSMLELARRLAPSFSITFLTTHGAPLPDWSGPSAAFLRRVHAPVRLLELPPVDFTPDPSDHGVTTMARFISLHKPHIKAFLSDLAQRARVAGVVTEFVTSMVDAANELGLPAFVYFPSSAACLSSIVFPPPLPLAEQVHIAGISPVPRSALPGAMAVPDGYETFTYHAARFRQAQGIVVNTFLDLEPLVLEVLRASDLPPVHTVGPLLAPAAPGDHGCVRWLDAQPAGSVVFLCFGSMGCFGADQVREIAAGLEASGARFLWALRAKGAAGPRDADPDSDLPEGFADRTRARGMVWPRWAPQAEVLAHSAVGGFVTHCGWNSVLEAVSAGVPMLAWPLYAEQRLNARELVSDIGVAVELRIGDEEGALVPRAEVERGVRCLMGEGAEGRRVREKVRDLRARSASALQDGGSSSVSLRRWVQRLAT